MEVSGIEGLIGLLKYPSIFDNKLIVYQQNMIHMSKAPKTGLL